ncbi:hypothetical protein N656DRAFT_69041 [Canariomyces notabilis]|uniref:Uncharacterized protein n=1 Tax=Canariomyces notabilis TaxID=2074819 RepID=A0AAN6YY11_9PEZI|nr:hypothetical protein N656DRAFT_69041 [Canariomyces arenarius]
MPNNRCTQLICVGRVEQHFVLVLASLPYLIRLHTTYIALYTFIKTAAGYTRKFKTVNVPWIDAAVKIHAGNTIY